MYDVETIVGVADTLTTRLKEALALLNELLAEQADAQERFEVATQEKELYEAYVLLDETTKEGAINGSNSFKRGYQTTIFLTDVLPGTDVEYRDLLDSWDVARLRLNDAKLKARQAGNTLSVVKYQARLTEAVLKGLE